MQKQSIDTSNNFYLSNFQVLTDFVYAHYEQLLSDEERRFYHKLNSLPESARLLCIRLLMRRGEYVRQGKVNYPEINPISIAFGQLLAAGLLQKADPECVNEWQKLFTRNELTSVNYTPTDNSSESIAVPDLLGNTPLELLQHLDTVYLVSCKAHYQVYLLLFFGNIHQDLTEFILRDLGIRHYENYLTDTTALPFISREHLQAYIHYYQCVEMFDMAVEQGVDALVELFQSLPATDFNDPILQRRQHKLYNHIARQLEREKALQQAAEIYRHSEHSPARERLARVEAACGNDTTAKQICNEILEKPRDSEEKEFAVRFSYQVCRRLGISSEPPTIYKPPQLTLELPSLLLPVECATALHFAKTGHCYYVENSLVTAAFGLSFWDIIFAPLNGVFFNPFQRAPLDFYDPGFTSRRRELIEKRLNSITTGNLKKHLFTHYHCKRGIINPMVNWSAVNYNLLALSLTRIPGKDWRSMFEYLLQDLKNHRCGLPDLVYFPDAGGYQFLEVKGPGDTIQQHQRRWMKHFNDHNIPHALINVEYERLAASNQPVTALTTC